MTAGSTEQIAADSAAEDELTAPPRRQWKPFIIRWTVFLVGLYSLVFGLMVLFEDRLVNINFGQCPDWPSFPHEDVWIKTSDGVNLHARFAPCPNTGNVAESPLPDGRPVVLFFHGNAGTIGNRYRTALRWIKEIGADVLMVEYRGFGRSEGKPSEAGLYADARAGYAWLRETKKVPADRIIIVGESLGGGVAVQLATEVEFLALILERTFTSLPDAAASHYGIFPVRTFMKNRFDSVSKIQAVKGPVFVAGAPNDQIIPFRQSETLFATAPEPKEFHRMDPSSGHDTSPLPEYFDKVRDFVRRMAAMAAVSRYSK